MNLRYSILILLLFSFTYSFSQVPTTCGACKNCENDCGPYAFVNNRESIIGSKVNEQPFNGIIHIEVKRLFGGPSYSTATFIEKDVLITANHNVMVSGAITRIAFCLKTPTEDKWITIKRRDFDIEHLTSKHDKRQDIALIKLKVTDFLRSYAYTIFKVADIDSLKLLNTASLHLTGFPCDRPDTLVNKSTSKSQLQIDKTSTTIGYTTLFTCTGDSGAPLWTAVDKQYYIVGIHHGGDDIGAFTNQEEINLSTKVTPTILAWIRSKTR